MAFKFKIFFFLLVAFGNIFASASCNSVDVTTPGSLSTLLTQAQKDTCTQLTVRGKLNSADIRVLRQMGGADNGKGVLKLLDLRSAKIVKDNRPYMTLDVKKEGIEACAHVVSTSSGDVHYIEYAVSYHDIRQEKLYKPYLTSQDYWWDKNKNNTYEVKLYLNENKHNSNFSHDSTYNTRWISPNDGNDWEQLCKSNAKEGYGYALEYKDGRCKYHAKAKKNTISEAMFYGCKSLELVIIPRKAEYNTNVIVRNRRYVIAKPSRDDKQMLYILYQR